MLYCELLCRAAEVLSVPDAHSILVVSGGEPLAIMRKLQSIQMTCCITVVMPNNMPSKDCIAGHKMQHHGKRLSTIMTGTFPTKSGPSGEMSTELSD